MKKALSLLLVLVLALGMSTVAFAATNATKIDYADWSYDDNFLMTAVPYNQQVDGDGTSTIYIPIVKSTNLAAVDTSTTASGGTSGDIKENVFSKSDMGVKLRWSKGSQLLDEAKINKKQSRVEVIFLTKVASIKDIDYKFEVLVTFGSRTLAGGTSTSNTYGTAPTFEGTWSADDRLEEIGDADWFDFDGTAHFKTDTFIRKFEYNFSDLATVHGRALKGVKYWGRAKDEPTDADQDLMIEHSAIVGVIYMNQINVKGVADYVTINDADASIYVYTMDNGQLKYLDRGNANLPYADVYYLAAAELDTDDVEPDDGGYDDGGDDSYVPAEDLGGDDEYPSNPHDNPGTGK